jgi:large subunit ribosomal protein L16
MFLQPKEKKFKKERKGRISGISFDTLNFGTFGIKSLECSRISARQIETARRVISKRVKATGKMWIRIFPAKPISAKPNEVRMGKGKGPISYWAAEVKPGKIMYEMEGISETLALKIFKTLSLKSPIKISLVTKFLKL